MKHPARILLAAITAVLLFAICLNSVSVHLGTIAAVGVGLAVLSLPALINPPSCILRVAATAPLDTPAREGDLDYIPVAAATLIYQGVLVAIDANGRAVNASDTAALRVIGRAEETIDNSSGAAGALFINVRRGIFRFANSAANAIAATAFNKPAYVEDNQTVASTSVNKVLAGRIRSVDADGVWVDTRARAMAAVAVASVQEATANGSDAATTQALANSLKSKYNTLQTDVVNLKAALDA